MFDRGRVRVLSAVVAAAAVAVLSPPALGASLDPAGSTRVGTVDPEFVSFGIDISQITERSSGAPFDFGRPRLAALARALGPAYLRFSGTKIDQTYYRFVLGSGEWDAAYRFAAANGLRVIIGVNGGRRRSACRPRSCRSETSPTSPCTDPRTRRPTRPRTTGATCRPSSP